MIFFSKMAKESRLVRQLNCLSILQNNSTFFITCRRGFRLPQRSHLRTLKNFVSEKSGKRCKKSGKYCIKSGNWEILRWFIYFLYPRLTCLWSVGTAMVFSYKDILMTRQKKICFRFILLAFGFVFILIYAQLKILKF